LRSSEPGRTLDLRLVLRARAASEAAADEQLRSGAHALCANDPTSNAMMTLADLNRLWPADHNATPWVATPDGSWTRMAGAGVNPDMLALPREGRRLTAPIA
jgi:hypothetical protein